MSVDIYIYLFDSQPYEESLLPAYRSFVLWGNAAPLVELLRNAIPKLGSLVARYGATGLSAEIWEERIDILTGRRYYSSQAKEPKAGDVTTPEDLRIFVDELIGPDLLQVFCIPQNLGVNPEQSMSRRALVEYLYSQSRWIEDYFTGSRQVMGPVPEIKLGESCQFFSREEVEMFDKELLRLERPVDAKVVADGFDNLNALVHKVVTDPHLRLLYVYM